MPSCEIKLGRYVISESSPCFVIAEIGHNHQGNLELAKKIVDAAAASGAHAVKLQKRSNPNLFTAAAYNKPYDNENSFGETYGKHREALEFGETEYLELKAYAESKGLVFFATPFDFWSVDFLEKIGVPAYKIASACITDIPLIEYMAQKGKPIFISTGTATLEDVDRAYAVIKRYNVPLCILQCTAAYPIMNYSEINLGVICSFKERYPDALFGYSGHESGIVLPIAAYVLGARVVEKHFTLNRALKGTDQKFSLEPQGMQKLTRDLARVYEAIGDGSKKPQPCEADAGKKLGKSIAAKKAISKGTLITPDLIVFKSPGGGLPPYKVEDVLGRVAEVDIPQDKLIEMNDLGSDQKQKFGKVDWGSVYAK